MRSRLQLSVLPPSMMNTVPAVSTLKRSSLCPAACGWAELTLTPGQSTVRITGWTGESPTGEPNGTHTGLMTTLTTTLTVRSPLPPPTERLLQSCRSCPRCTRISPCATCGQTIMWVITAESGSTRQVRSSRNSTLNPVSKLWTMPARLWVPHRLTIA